MKTKPKFLKFSTGQQKCVQMMILIQKVWGGPETLTSSQNMLILWSPNHTLNCEALEFSISQRKDGILTVLLP